MDTGCNVYRDWRAYEGPSVVATIGHFDGLHVGHQYLIRQVVQKAQQSQCEPMLITFEPYAHEYFNPRQNERIMLARDKIELAASMGIRHIVLCRFNHDLATMPAPAFVQTVLKQVLCVKELIVGDDFCFGHQKKGNVKLLKQYIDADFNLTVAKVIQHGQDKVSSSRLRQCLTNAQLDDAKTLLGRPFHVTGHVQYGEGRGKTLGFPTANIRLPERFLVPRGVFYTQVEGVFGLVDAITNVGTRPTFGGQMRVIESHLLGYSGNLYGQRIKCHFLRKIRDERAFSNKTDLVNQIESDLAMVKAIQEKV